MSQITDRADKLVAPISLDGGRPGVSAQQPQIDPVRAHLQMLFGILSRKRWFLVGFVAAVTCIVAAAVMRIAPLYDAEVRLVLEEPRGVGTPQSLLIGGSDNSSSETEAAILASTTYADKIIDRFNLTASPFFTEGLSDQAPARELRNAAYKKYFRSLTVRPGDRSRVMDLRFVADDPKMAADIANELANVYIEEHRVANRQAVERDTVWLTTRVDELRASVKEAQRKVEEFKSAHGVLDVGSTSLLQRQIADYNQQLTTAQIDHAQAEEKAQLLNRLAQMPDGIAASSQALDSPAIRQLRDEEIAATRKIAELSKQYRDGYPALAQAKAELGEIESKLALELQRITASVAHQAELAREHEAQISGKLDQLTRALQRQADTEESLNVLQVDLKTTTDFYATMLDRLREADSFNQRVEQPSARIISLARPSEAAFYPKRGVIIGTAALGSALIGIMLAFLMEALDVGFRNDQQIEMMTGLETLTSLPKVRTLVRKRRLGDIPSVFRDEPIFAEAVRYARVGLLMSAETGRMVKSILVTSALPRESKTLTARALAVTCGLGGAHVMIVNCDLRKKQTGARRTDGPVRPPGLLEYLNGSAEIDEVIYKDPITGVNVIESGTTDGTVDAPILLGSTRMRALLDELNRRYDLVILDTPPVKMFPDALVLQNWVDKVYFVVAWAKTRREVAVDALKVIVQAGCLNPVVGLTCVNMHQLPRYDYSSATPQRDAMRFLQYWRGAR